MALDRIAFMVVDAAGVPKTDAQPKFSIYRGRTLADRTPPTGSLATPIPHIAGGLYGCTGTEGDVAEGVAYLIDCGAGGFNAQGGTRVFGTIHAANNPYFAQLFEDGAGALWAGTAATLGIWTDMLGAAGTPPAVVAIAGTYFLGFTPPRAELLDGRVFRWNAAAGAYPAFPHGVAFFGQAGTSDTLGELIRQQLVGSATVTDLVGTRIYPLVLPQGILMPAISYNIITDVPLSTLGGVEIETLSDVRFQIDSYAKTYEVAHQVDEAVRDVVGDLGAYDLSAWRLSSRDLYEDQTRFFRVQTDYTVHRGVR